MSQPSRHTPRPYKSKLQNLTLSFIRSVHCGGCGKWAVVLCTMSLKMELGWIFSKYCFHKMVPDLLSMPKSCVEKRQTCLPTGQLKGQNICASCTYLSRGGHHHHHLLQVKLIPRKCVYGDLILHTAARLPGIIEEFPEVGHPGLQQDKLGREALENHG